MNKECNTSHSKDAWVVCQTCEYTDEPTWNEPCVTCTHVNKDCHWKPLEIEE